MKYAGLMVVATAALMSTGCTHKLVDQKAIDWNSCYHVDTETDDRTEIKQFQCGPASIVYGVARKVLRNDSDFPHFQKALYKFMKKTGPTLEAFTGMTMNYGDEFDMGDYEALEVTFTMNDEGKDKLMAQGYLSLAHDGSNIYISFCASSTTTNELCGGALDDLFNDVKTPISDQLPR